ncbi:TIGR01458 family HAD-type hydrolase [Sulfurimonas sp.]
MINSEVKAILCDIGGVLYVGESPIEGAIEAIKSLKSRYPIRFLTNTTQKTSSEVVLKLQAMGFDIEADEVITALDVTKIYLKQRESYAEFLLTDDALNFFDALQDYPKKYVVVGDAQENFSYKNLNNAFRSLINGCELLAIATNRYFLDADNKLSMDVGCFVSALEYGSAKKAHLIGKPSREFYHLACQDMDVDPDECLMIGDDIVGDIQGAQNASIKAVLVQTGKFQASDLDGDIEPDIIVKSIADLALPRG